MLKINIDTLVTEEEDLFYLFELTEEEITWSFPLNRTEIKILESCLEGCLYQNVEDLSLEICKVKADNTRKLIYITFINNSPIMTFKLQRSEAIIALQKIRSIVD